MKKMFKMIGILSLMAIICFSMLACVNNKKGNTGGTTPEPVFSARLSEPEAMSGKTALKFLRDNDIKLGWNLGNTLDAVTFSGRTAVRANETAWGNPLATQQLFNGVKESGFDIVRITCTWIGHIGPAPNYTIDIARLQRVEEMVVYAKNAGFKAIVINIHHDGNYTQPPNTWGFLDFAGAVNNPVKRSQIQDQLGKVWTQIANYFINYGDYLIFETLNEIHSGNWGSGNNNDPAYRNQQDILFDWNQTALSAIRATGGNNATRFVAVPGLGSTEPPTVTSAHARGKLLPNDGANGTNKLIVSVHFYDPWRFTVADATPSATNNQPLLHTWGTSAEIAKLEHEMNLLKTTFIDKNIAVYIGECGAPTQVRSSMDSTIKNTHLNYIGKVAGAAAKNGVPPIFWDDGGNFKILERSNGRPKPGLWADTLSAIMSAR